MMKLLLVDDEELARQRLHDMLADAPEVAVVGEAASAAAAVERIAELDPDVVLLDIQLADATGFDVLEEIGADAMPLTIFVTAYDEFAVRAFEVAAVDYLLKPFDRDRLLEALDRARERLAANGGAAPDRRLAELLRLVEGGGIPAGGFLTRLLVPDGKGQVVLPVKEIHHIEAAGNYVKIHTGDGSYLLRETLATLEERLDPGMFARVHRSSILNLDRLEHLEPWFSGDLVAVMEGGRKVRVSRTHRPELERRLGG